MAITVLIAIGIVIGSLYVWITNVRQSEGGFRSIGLSLEPPAGHVGANTYEIRVGQTASLRIMGTFSNGSTLDVSADPDLTYHLSPCEELSLDETNNRVTGLLVSEHEIPLYAKINTIKSNTIYIEVVLPPC